MFRRLQFTFPEGAIFISCVDQKLWTLEEMMDSLYARWLLMAYCMRIPKRDFHTDYFGGTNTDYLSNWPVDESDIKKAC